MRARHRRLDVEEEDSCKGQNCIPPKPVAKPTVPSVASISIKIDPRTLMPQLVREFLYFSHPDIGVEIGESTSLWSGQHGILEMLISQLAWLRPGEGGMKAR